jgi:DNA polymerase III epsilon subunit-like protein
MRRRRGRTEAAARFARTPRAAAATPWREAAWCALDLELTGLDPQVDQIIAVGMVPIERGRVQLGRAAYTLVRSSRRSAVGAVLAHKLRVEDLVGAPPLDDALELILTELAGRIPVFHAAAVERAFLAPLFRGRRARLPEAVDTEALGRRWLGLRDGASPPSISLERLAEQLGQRPQTAHHALGDALTTAQAFVALATLLDAGGRQTAGTLRALSAAPQNSWR